VTFSTRAALSVLAALVKEADDAASIGLRE
jgi:hypothetical protein